MPVGSFIIQPIANSLHAAYRPIIIRVVASSSNVAETATPPVVFCDIYFNGTFYKSQSKTIYTKLGLTSSEYQFDIQEAAQEFLGKFLPTYAYANVAEASPLICSAFVKIRSSFTNTNGFVESEVSAPIQGTGSSLPIGGEGTASNTFYVVNACLQHSDNQDLSIHLSYFKNRTWDGSALPLSHRPDGYRQAPTDHDMFPIIYRGSNLFKSLRLNYKLKGQTTYHQLTANIAPAASCNVQISILTVVHIGNNYGVNWSLLSGNPTKYYISTPAISGGAPAETTQTQWSFGSSLPPGSHLITVRPLCLIEGEYYLGTAQTVTIDVPEAPPCVGVGFSDALSLPSGTVDTPYLYSFALTGTAPFSVDIVTKPSWMTIAVVGSEIQISGTPDTAASEIEVDFTVKNCSAANSKSFEDTFNVAEAAESGDFMIQNASLGRSILNVYAGLGISFYLLDTGDFPLNAGLSAIGVQHGTASAITVEVSSGSGSCNLKLIINSSLIQTLPVTAAGEYTFNPYLITTSMSVEIKLEQA